MGVTVMLIRSGTISVSRIVPGFPLMFIDNWVVLSLEKSFFIQLKQVSRLESL